MSIVAHDHNPMRRILLTFLFVMIVGFSFGAFGAHAFTSAARPEPRLAVRKASVLSVRPAAVATAAMKKVAPTKQLPAPAPVSGVQKKETTVSTKNTILIPRMGVDTAILEGPDEKTLNKGVWHLPGTSNPAKGGNVVISAHRYKWRPPSTKTFWDIDKMKVGDLITITWEGKKYTYKVTKSYIVTPDRVDILADTKEHKLTLFSCTPKFTSKNRLVIEAYPVEG